MPYRPPRSCRQPQCPESAVRDGWCTTHYHPPFEHRRLEPMPANWKTIRAAVLRRDHGCCVDCGAPATQVDHVKPRAWGGADTPENLQSVCTHHHQLRTARILAQARRT